MLYNVIRQKRVTMQRLIGCILARRLNHLGNVSGHGSSPKNNGSTDAEGGGFTVICLQFQANSIIYDPKRFKKI
jgi:hypothetical protein